jgi:hypothetical protein
MMIVLLSKQNVINKSNEGIMKPKLLNESKTC